MSSPMSNHKGEKSKRVGSEILPTLTSTSERMSPYLPPADRVNYPEEPTNPFLKQRPPARPPNFATSPEDNAYGVDYEPAHYHPESLKKIEHQARRKREKVASRAPRGPGVVTGFSPGSGVSLEDVRLDARASHYRAQRTVSTNSIRQYSIVSSQPSRSSEIKANNETSRQKAIKRQLPTLGEYFCDGVNLECPSFDRTAECEAVYQSKRTDKRLDGSDKSSELRHVNKHLFKYHDQERNESINGTIAKLKNCIELRHQLMAMPLSLIRSKFPCTEDVLSHEDPDISMMQKATNIARCIVSTNSSKTQRGNAPTKCQNRRSTGVDTENSQNNLYRVSSRTEGDDDTLSESLLSQISTVATSSSVPNSPRYCKPADLDVSIEGDDLECPDVRIATNTTWPMRIKRKINEAEVLLLEGRHLQLLLTTLAGEDDTGLYDPEIPPRRTPP